MTSKPGRVHELASRVMDGSLTPSEERELGAVLRSSAEAREIMLSYFRLEGAMTELARIEWISKSGPSRTGSSAVWRRRALSSSPLATPRPVPQRALWAAGLLGAAAILGLLYGTTQSPSSPVSGIGSTAKNPRLPGEPGRPAPSSPEPAPLSPSAPLPPQVAPSLTEVRPSPSAVSPATPTSPSPALPTPESGAPDVPEPRETSVAAEVVVTSVTLERVEGDVVLTGSGGPKSAHAGDVILQGQGLETGAGQALAVITFPDGTRLEARSETSLRDIRPGAPASTPAGEGRGGKSLYIQRGSVWAHVRPQPNDRPLVLGTPRGEARILGTILTLRVDPDPAGTVRLDVQEGKVRFTRAQDGRSVDIPSGHSVSSAAGSDLTLLRSTEVIASFQDGAAPTADYLGTRDTSISEKNPLSNFGRAKSLVAEGEEGRGRHKAQWLLLRWDLSSIPAGSRVRSASITLNITAASQGYPFCLYEPARAWSETEATWKLAVAGTPWRFPGSLGGNERWGPPSGTLAPLVKGEYTAVLSEAGITVVQSWVNAPAGNFGFLIASPEALAGLHISSREAQPPETRPKLTVVYVPRR